jgi:hypothetical protein
MEGSVRGIPEGDDVVDPEVGVRGWRERARRCRSRRSAMSWPPHTPCSWPACSAHARQSSVTEQRRHTALAAAICRWAGPLSPIGKNISGSVLRQAARCRKSLIRVLSFQCSSYASDRSGRGPRHCRRALAAHGCEHVDRGVTQTVSSTGRVAGRGGRPIRSPMSKVRHRPSKLMAWCCSRQGAEVWGRCQV